jgi:hypothetical protein
MAVISVINHMWHLTAAVHDDAGVLKSAAV